VHNVTASHACAARCRDDGGLAAGYARPSCQAGRDVLFGGFTSKSLGRASGRAKCRGIQMWKWLNRLLVIAVIVSFFGAALAWLRADPPPDELTIATWNVEWMFDEYQGDNYSRLARAQSAPSRAEWEWKRNGVAAAIAEMKPTILALQEVESQRIMYYLDQRLKKNHQLDYRTAFIQGGDYYTEQDVALMYQSGLVKYWRCEQSREMWESKRYYNVQKHLFGEFRWGNDQQGDSLVVVTVHFRAMPAAADIRRKQARLVRYWIADLLRTQENLVVLGDFNSEESYGDTSTSSEMGILRGLDTPDEADDLVDLHQYLPPDERGTHLSRGKQFDRILVSQSLMEDEPGRVDLVFRSIELRQDLVVRGTQDQDHWDKYYDIPQQERDLSDHYPLVARFVFQ
jgi:endonuclease/exonuclease/phosphatase family metal-dependent hydrolase